jgi:hypothetical protein
MPTDVSQEANLPDSLKFRFYLGFEAASEIGSASAALQWLWP